MNPERGQALVEAVVAAPACLACALLLVDCGLLVSERIAVAQAATRAAEAQVAGLDPEQSARDAVAPSLREGLAVSVEQDSLSVRVASRSRAAQLVGGRIVHRSEVELAGVAR